MEELGVPDARFNYLGEEKAVKDIPTQVGWFPFGRYVTFPGEADWFVNFFMGQFRRVEWGAKASLTEAYE